MTAHAPLEAVCNQLRHLHIFEVEDAHWRLLCKSGDADLGRHLELDAGRLGLFMTLLPGSGRGLRVLDLGANPYILSYALARSGAEVVAGGHPHHEGGVRRRKATDERVAFRDGDRLIAELPLVRFNVEADRFPFEDGTFDAVVCGELIEHLAVGPAQMLHECNRVLATGGRLLLSTPNSVSLARIIGLIRGASLDWPYSDQGIYARHNRLYTIGELRDLMIGNGFRPILEKGVTFPHRREWYGTGPLSGAKHAAMSTVHQILQWQSVRLRRLAEGLLIAGEKVEGPRFYRPSWLFGGADSIPMVADGGPAHRC